MRLTEEQFAELERRRGALAKRQASSPQKRVQALGRLKPGEMNKTEARYAEHLEAERLAGEIAWWAFEAVKLRLAPNTHLTVDFFVMRSDGRLEAHDVKGAKGMRTDDAVVKMKVAAQMFPWPFFYVYPPKKGENTGWLIEAV